MNACRKESINFAARFDWVKTHTVTRCSKHYAAAWIPAVANIMEAECVTSVIKPILSLYTQKN